MTASTAVARRFAAAGGSTGRLRCSKNGLAAALSSHHHRLGRTATTAATSGFSSSSSSSSSTTTTTAPASDETDVLIVGGGAVGCALARELTQKIPGLSVDLIEAGPGHANSASTAAIDADAPPHARSYALSPASLDVLGTNFKNSNSNRIGYYDSMQIWEANQPSVLLFTSQDLADSGENNQGVDYLGACVEDRVVVDYLWKEMDEKGVRIHTNTTVANLDMPEHSSQGLARVQLQSKHGDDKKREIKTHLLVAADGGNSSIRRMLGIPLRRLDYGQMALTFTVELQEPHGGRAFQRFLSNGGAGAEPLALLPTFSDRHAVVVWSTTPDTVKQWKGHPDLLHYVNDLLQQGPQLLNPLFGSSYDQNPKNERTGGDTLFSNLQYGAEKLVETLQYAPALMAASDAAFCAPPRLKTSPDAMPQQQFAFPLTTGHVTQYADDHKRMALIGDAAHTMHPMAGQGLNLGMQDVADLTTCIQKASQAGMDVNTFLKSDYDCHRHLQVGATLAGIHSLHGLYGMQHTVAKHAKSLGMNVIQNVGLLRRQLAQAACHGVALPS